MSRQISLKATAVFCALAFFTTDRVSAQGVSGSVTGSVVDPSGAVVPVAKVTLINENTGDRRDPIDTESDGTFILNGIFPGRYTLHIEATGFKPFERREINVTAAERASVGALALSVGGTTESVTVTAQGALVQTASQERSAVLTSNQVENLASQGRMIVGLLRVLPGIPNPGEGGGLPNVNGLPRNFASMTTDGTPNTELGTAGFSSTRATLDAVSEVKVLSSNYQSEYGAHGGAVIQLVTKAGTSSFHGTAYWYKQHEMFNANNFFSNRTSVPRPKSRVSVLGGTIGGPIYIPGKFNVNKDKLFFFWSQDDRRQPYAQRVGLRTSTVPTDLERSGDFSQTRDVGNNPVNIRDPLTGANFPGNVIPASRINQNGQRLLSVFPKPNFFDRAISNGNYNYTVQNNPRNIRTQWVNRFDYNATSRIRLYVRGIREVNQEFDWQYLDTAPLLPGLNYIPKTDGGINSVQIISPTVVNEFLFGTHHRTEYRSVAPVDDPHAQDSATPLKPYSKTALGISLPQLYNNNPFDVIPSMSFSDVPSAMTVNWASGGYFPPTTSELSYTFSDSISKVLQKHTIKAGVSYMHLMRAVTGSGPASGNFAFGRDINNPNDARYGYANALLGNFTTYSEASSVPLLRDKAAIVEWFLQDNWKATARLTLDYGMRFSWFTPYTQSNGQASNFLPEIWDPKKAPTLYAPALNSANQRVARNPLSGEFAPVTLIGALVPNSGDANNGVAVGTDSRYDPGFLKRQGVIFGPRFGIAYDVLGDGKTALRAGGGIFTQTESTNTETVYAQNPPFQNTPTIYYGNLSDYYKTAGVLFPSATTRGFALAGNAPMVYSYSIGVQRDIGFNTVVDVAYVGNQSRHNTQTRNINLLAPGTRFLSSSIDPTRAGTPLPDNFLRPYRGYGDILIGDRTGNTNYNSLQTQANRRFSRGIQFGATWTWSKAMAYDSSPANFLPARLYSYGRADFDFTHIVVLNWVWDTPRVSRVLGDHRVVGWALDNWRLSGIGTFQSGSPLNISFTTADGADLTGGGDPIRVDIVGDPYIAKSDRSFARQFDPTVFRRPARGAIGNLGRGLLSGPGTNNFDLTLAKEFGWRERVKFRMQFEAYNAFNHTQYSSVDTAARFDAAGVQTNARLGQFTAARTPRQGQASLRLTF